MSRRIRFILAGILWVCMGSMGVRAEGPVAADLLPQETVAYVCVTDSADFAARLQSTSAGQLLRDEQVRPLYEQLYGSVTPALQQVEQRLGVTLDEMLKIPEGELTLAVVALPDAGPALVALLETGQKKSIDQLLEQGGKALLDAGFTVADEPLAQVPARIFSGSSGPVREVVQLRLGERLVLTSSRRVAEQIVSLSQQKADQTSLRQLSTFQSVMSRCQPSGSPAQLTWYVDPIALVRAATRSNPAAAAGLALLPAIGLDGLLALGGSVQLAEGDFDNVSHIHLLLDQPRDGVLELIALRSGSSQPESWVPGDVADYATWHWNLPQTLATVTELFDSFRGDGALATIIKSRVSDPLGVDLQTDLLPALAGRFTRIVWFQRPVTLDSQATLLAVQLKDPAAFRPTLSKITDKFADSLESTTFGGITVYSVKRPQSAEEPAADASDAPRDARRRRPRRPQVTLAIVGDYLLLADRASVIEHTISAQQGAVPRLRDELDYQLIQERIQRQITNQRPGLISFQRPEESLRAGYELLRSDDVRQRIHAQRDANPFFRAIDDALEQDKFPAFSVIARYLAPGGALLIDEETGLHYIRFTLRRQEAAADGFGVR